MNVPKKVRIGAVEYDIETSPEMLEWAHKREGEFCVPLDGYISFRHERIIVNTADCKPNTVRYTLAHEIVHGILDHLGYGKAWLAETGAEDYEEVFVTNFAAAWLEVVRRNPDVSKFLAAK